MSDGPRQSRDLTRGDLLLIIGQLRGELYGIAYSPVPVDPGDVDQHVLDDSSFDISEEDEEHLNDAKIEFNRRLYAS